MENLPEGYRYVASEEERKEIEAIRKKRKRKKYAFDVKDLKATGVPKSRWPLNNGTNCWVIEKITDESE